MESGGVETLKRRRTRPGHPITRPHSSPLFLSSEVKQQKTRHLQMIKEREGGVEANISPESAEDSKAKHLSPICSD